MTEATNPLVCRDATYLLQKYGSVELLAGHKLWTNKDEDGWIPPDHEVFFHVKPGCVYGGRKEYPVVTSHDMRLIAPFTVQPHDLTRSISLFEDLCDELDVEGPVADDEVSWKKDFTKRKACIQKLMELGINGWCHPFQSSTFYMEVCIFHAQSMVSLSTEGRTSPTIAKIDVSLPLPKLTDTVIIKFKMDMEKVREGDATAWHCLEHLIV
jgi:hypothetical protein